MDPISSVSAIINLGSKINAMYPTYAKKHGFVVRITEIKAQKIDGTTLETFKIVIVAFSVYDKAEKVRFFEETFLLADINMDVVLKMFFLTLSNINIYFTKQGLYWRSYTTVKALSTTCYIELIN